MLRSREKERERTKEQQQRHGDKERRREGEKRVEINLAFIISGWSVVLDVSRAMALSGKGRDRDERGSPREQNNRRVEEKRNKQKKTPEEAKTK